MSFEYRIAGVITAAGSSTRMGGMKKELALIDGRPVLKIVSETFYKCGLFDKVVITYPFHPDHPDGCDSGLTSALKGVDLDLIWVPGGKTRQGSVYNALQALSGLAVDYVLIHDAARPWVTVTIIKSVLDKTIEHGACIPVVPHVNASKRVGSGGEILEHHDRSAVVGAQTPQGFRYADILKAHEEAREVGMDYPDDAEAYHNTVGPVFTVPGDPANRKITFRYDL